MGTKPYNEEEKQVEQIRKMFNNIAPNYDLLNKLMSFGKFNGWRKELINVLSTFSPEKVLDIATGTADLAIDLAQNIPSINHITGVDISEEMMRIGKNKVLEASLSNKISFHKEDATKLSFENDSFDAVTISFGIRNFDDIPAAVKETFRVLKPNGIFIFLELTEPQNKLLRPFYKLYSKFVMPKMGELLTGDKKAYIYLPKSMALAPSRQKLVDILTEAGFKDSFYRDLKLETCALYMGVKPLNTF